MKRHPQWNRSKHNGSEWERALCYHSGVAEGYIWPMLKEIIAGYHPDGFWLDGSVFTIHVCYCQSCQERFKHQTGTELPANEREPGWPQFHEMQRHALEMAQERLKTEHALEVEFVFEDTRNDPKVGEQGVRKLIQEQGVSLVLAFPCAQNRGRLAVYLPGDGTLPTCSRYQSAASVLSPTMLHSLGHVGII
jgi:hypothetical protein